MKIKSGQRKRINLYLLPLQRETGSGERRAWWTWRGRSGRRWRGLSGGCKTASGTSCSWTQKWQRDLQKSQEFPHPPVRLLSRYFTYVYQIVRFYLQEAFPPQTIWNCPRLSFSADVNQEVGQNIIFPFGSVNFPSQIVGRWHPSPLHYVVINNHHYYAGESPGWGPMTD